MEKKYIMDKKNPEKTDASKEKKPEKNRKNIEKQEKTEEL